VPVLHLHRPAILSLKTQGGTPCLCFSVTYRPQINRRHRSTSTQIPPLPPLPRTLLLWLTPGVAGTVLFPIIYVIDGTTRPGYDAWRPAISALSLGPGGGIQQLNFVLCGVSVLWMAFVWRKILAGGVWATWYPIVRSIEGVGLVATAIFTQGPLHCWLICHRPTLLKKSSLARLSSLLGGLRPLADGCYALLRYSAEHALYAQQLCRPFRAPGNQRRHHLVGGVSRASVGTPVNRHLRRAGGNPLRRTGTSGVDI